MTKAPATTGSKTPEFREIPLADIIPTPDNTRVIDEASKDFREFVTLVKALGVQVPVHVRPHPTKEGKFDLRAGERRFRAAKAAGLTTIPAVVKDLSDDEALILTFQENFNREDLKPLEEGRIVSDLLDALGGDVNAVAARLGRKYTWVAQRANIYKGLARVWKDSISASDSPLANWSARSLALVARLPQEAQAALLVELAKYNDLDHVSLEGLEGAIANLLRPLSMAPWSLDDNGMFGDHAALPACTACEKRSSLRPDLWSDSDDDPEKNDRCLDAECWRAKTTAQIVIKASSAKAAHGEVVFVESPKRADWNAVTDASATFGSTLRAHEYRKVSAKAPGAKPAVITCGEGTGTMIWIQPNSPSSRTAKGESKPKPLAERRKGLESKRWVEVARRLSDDVAKSVYSDLPGKPAVLVQALAAVFGVEKHYVEVGADWDIVDGLDKPAAVSVALWDVVKPVLAKRLMWIGPVTQMPDRYIEEARRVAAVIGLDIEALYATVSTEKGFTEPKSWAAEMKTVAASKPAKPKAAKPAKKVARSGKGKAKGGRK